MNQNSSRESSIAPALQLERVRYEVDGIEIIKQVTGDMPTGKITALIGPTGSGKTTLLKLCNGLISSSDGQISIEGKLIEGQSPMSVRRQVGIVLQSSPMIPGTVHDNLALPLQLQGQTLSDELARQTMKRVGLNASLLKRNAREISGGQQQKVSIARTLLNQSKILLLDEITASLDPYSLQEIENVIIELNETEKITVVWITHNLEQAHRLGEYFWVMIDGELRATGTKEEIAASEDREVERFVEEVFI